MYVQRSQKGKTHVRIHEICWLMPSTRRASALINDTYIFFNANRFNTKIRRCLRDLTRYRNSYLPQYAIYFTCGRHKNSGKFTTSRHSSRIETGGIKNVKMIFIIRYCLCAQCNLYLLRFALCASSSTFRSYFILFLIFFRLLDKSLLFNLIWFQSSLLFYYHIARAAQPYKIACDRNENKMKKKR